MIDCQEAISILKRTPQIIRVLLEGCPKGWINQDEGEGTWSPGKVLCHLVHGERTYWMNNFRIILNGVENKAINPFDRAGQFEVNQQLSIKKLLNEFAELRRLNINEIQNNLTINNLGLIGVHKNLGKITLKELVFAWAVHDLGHINQVSRVIAKRFRGEIGPWQPYMSIVNN